MKASVDIYDGPEGVKLYLDPNDPDTPAIVEWKGSTGTYDCAVSTSELIGGNTTVVITDEQIAWLEEYRDEVEEVFNIARKDNPNYG